MNEVHSPHPDDAGHDVIDEQTWSQNERAQDYHVLSSNSVGQEASYEVGGDVGNATYG